MTGTGRTQVAQGIGSTFATERPSESPSAIPWSQAGPVRYVQSGGQALRLVSDVLWAEGRRTLLIPGFLCESMIEPFAGRPWNVRHVPLTEDLRTAPGSVGPWVDQPESTAVLVAEYFGRTLDGATVESLVELQRAGVSIVEDRTHNLLDWDEPFADFVIASLRKLLPVGDGAFVLGDVNDARSADSNPGDDYWAAMDLKAAAGGRTEARRARDLFVRAEQRFAAELTPGAASARTIEALQHLDFAGMAEVRRGNAGILRELLGDADVLTDPRDDEDLVPSHLVVRVEDPATVQQRMAENGVFCPIHWPTPSRLPAGHPWPANLISLPIDHRYGPSEMAAVARSFRAIVQV